MNCTVDPSLKLFCDLISPVFLPTCNTSSGQSGDSIYMIYNIMTIFHICYLIALIHFHAIWSSSKRYFLYHDNPMNLIVVGSD